MSNYTSYRKTYDLSSKCFINIKLPLFFVVSFLCSKIFTQADEVHDFCSSFINSYDLTGRYTHEYHPYILHKAQESFLTLQKYLQSNGYHIEGHELIFGYQEDAIVPYQTQWNRVQISDEAIVKKHAGLCSPVKNLFGFITGFLLKDAEWLYKRWHPNIEPLIEHIFANPIELFNDYSVIFQKHAFGKDFDYFIKVRNGLERSIYKNEPKNLLADLVHFWTIIYEQFSRSGSNQVIATQDLVFSIDYAKALLDHSVTINKIYIGPDITYPIEILAFQKQRATANAQKFLQRFVNRIQPIQGENTAYFFCSYVDGVGKSTHLNNIKNYQRYGLDLNKYARSDNSSSQLAEIYCLKEGVYLVDMPAQMSHFVPKPDGCVFADIDTIKDLAPTFCERVLKYIYKNKQHIIQDFLSVLTSVSRTNQKLYSSDNPIEQFAHNCTLFNTNLPNALRWVPLQFEDRYVLFNVHDNKTLKVLIPIAETHSKGLKEVSPELMLFNKGISFPMPYDQFLSDLNQKLANAHIKKVVFVDFLSMYPRSSRENVRLNFIMQYLMKLFSAEGLSFDINSTMYQHELYPEQETYFKLSHVFNKVRDNFMYETALRWALFELTNSDVSISITQAGLLEDILHSSINNFLNNYEPAVASMVTKKLKAERKNYAEKYRYDKVYENVVQFRFEPLIGLSDFLIQLFQHNIEHETLNQLWSNLDAEIKEIDAPNREVLLHSNELMEIKYKVHVSAREQDLVNGIIRTIRAQWYATLENLLHGALTDEKMSIPKMVQLVPPLILKHYGDYVYVLQKKMPLIDFSKKGDEKIEKPKLPIRYHLMDGDGKKKRWGSYDNDKYCLDWENMGTYFGIFSFGYFPFQLSRDVLTKTIESYKVQCAKNDHQEWGITITDLFNQAIGDKDIKQIKKEGVKRENMTVLEENDPRIPAIRLWARTIATLDMIAKDFSSELLIRKGSKEDFIATLKLLEITLAKYYLLDFNVPLFNNYESVKPVISWDLIKLK